MSMPFIFFSLKGSVYIMYYKPEEITNITIENGIKKTKYPYLKTCILGFLAGGFVDRKSVV